MFDLQDNPEPTRCLGVFGMGLYTTETELQHVFAKYGPLEKVQVVKDAKVIDILQKLLQNQM